MISGLILDVDGVLVGSKPGYNHPDPHPEVMQTLRTLHKNGMTISLCTGKGTFAIESIVRNAQLDNLHIGDGGAVVVDFIHDLVIDQHTIKTRQVLELLDILLTTHTYVELYTKDGYYIQKDMVSDKTKKHIPILQKEPHIITSLASVAPLLEIVKIMPVADNDEDKQRITALFAPFVSSLTLQWGVHLTALPYQFGIITEKGISKEQAARVISQYTEVPLTEMLGIGDGHSDWRFMEICGYAGAMGNASQELKDLVKTKGTDGYVGTSVDENGLLDILHHFNVWA